MAQKVHIVLEDDIDGSEADETVTFGLDGTTYEIDLNDKNAAALRDALAAYVGHGRKGERRRGKGRRKSPRLQLAQRPRDPRLGPLQRLQGHRPRPGLRRRPRGVRRCSLSASAHRRRFRSECGAGAIRLRSARRSFAFAIPSRTAGALRAGPSRLGVPHAGRRNDWSQRARLVFAVSGLLRRPTGNA